MTSTDSRDPGSCEGEADALRARLAAAEHELAELRGAVDRATREAARYRSLFESAVDVVLISTVDGTFVDANTRACELTGYTRDELLRMRPEELLSPEGPAEHNVDWGAYTPGRTYWCERTVRRKDGTLLPVEVSAGLVAGDTMYAVVRDVSARRDAAAEAARLKAFYENVLNQLPIQMAVLDREARYLYVNPAGVRDPEVRRWIVGKTTAEYGRAYYADPAPFEARYRWLLEVAQGDEIRQREERFTTRAGEVRHVLRIAVPIEGPGGDAQLLAFGLDVTEQKRFEEEIIRAKEAAEEMTQLKTALLANMSHEIRTPLTSIIGFGTLLAEEVEGPPRELARLIERGGKRLLDTLNAVLELSMLQSGSFQLDPCGLDVAAVARECVALSRSLAESKDVTLELSVPAAPVRAWLDEAALARILQNLIGNAIKFTPQGAVTVVVDEEPGSVVLRVRDTGVGIERAFLPHLFSEFKQESQGWKRSFEGTGLGLSVTRRLVELMQGTISVESEKGAGALFTVRLPSGLVDAAPWPAACVSGSRPSAFPS